MAWRRRRGSKSHRLFDDETLAVCSPALAAGPPAITRPADLEGVSVLHLDVSTMPWITVSCHWFDWSAWLASVGAGELRLSRGLWYTDYNLAIQAAIAGQGVALGSWPIVRDAIAAGLLVSPFAERARSGTGYDLVTTPRAAARPEVAAFVDWILSHVAEDGAAAAQQRRD